MQITDIQRLDHYVYITQISSIWEVVEQPKETKCAHLWIEQDVASVQRLQGWGLLLGSILKISTKRVKQRVRSVFEDTGNSQKSSSSSCRGVGILPDETRPRSSIERKRRAKLLFGKLVLLGLVCQRRRLEPSFDLKSDRQVVINTFLAFVSIY